jgi:hypothetical protein
VRSRRPCAPGSSGCPPGDRSRSPCRDPRTGGPGGGWPPAGAEHDVVEALLQHAEQVLAGHALLAAGFLVQVGERPLEHPVDVLGLLLLLQLQQVLGGLAATAAAVLTRGVGALVEGLGALLVLEDVDAETTRDLDLGAGVSSHDFLRVRSGAAWEGGSRCGAWGSRP